MAKNNKKGGPDYEMGGNLTILQRWKSIHSVAKKAQDAWKPLWTRSLNLYEARVPTEGNPSMRTVVVNLGYAYVRTAIPSLYFRDPYISINPTRPDEVTKAQVTEAVLNAKLKSFDLKRQEKRAIFDAITCGIGVIKYGNAPDVVLSETGPMVVRDNIFTRRCRPIDILFDPAAEEPADLDWVTHRVIKDVESIKKDKRYSNTEKVKGTLTYEDDLLPKGLSKREAESLAPKAELFECWDATTRMLRVYTPEVDEWLLEQSFDEMPWMQKIRLPFEFLSFNETNDKIYCIPDLIYIEDQLKELTNLRTTQASHVKKFVRIYLASKGIKDDEIERIVNAEDGAVVTVSDVNGVKLLEPGQIGPDFRFLQEDAKTDIREVLGQSEMNRGGVLDEKRTLGEVQMIARGGINRSEERVDRVEDHVENICVGLLKVMKATMDESEFVRMSGQPNWPPADWTPEQTTLMQVGTSGMMVTKDDILDEPDVEVKAGSALPLNREGELKRISVLREGAKESPNVLDEWEIWAEIFRLLDVKNQKLLRPKAQADQMSTPLMRGAGGLPGGPPGGPAGGGGVPPELMAALAASAHSHGGAPPVGGNGGMDLGGGM